MIDNYTGRFILYLPYGFNNYLPNSGKFSNPFVLTLISTSPSKVFS
jgi:hypothetical protein